MQPGGHDPDPVVDDWAHTGTVRRPAPAVPARERVRAWLGWFGVGRALAAALAVALVGVGGYWLLRTPAAPVETGLPVASRPTTATTGRAAGSSPPATLPAATSPVSDAIPASIVVHVAGAVVAPGVYRLAVTARVDDALRAAGGPAADADRDALNLAQPLHDGDRVYVPRAGTASSVPPGVSGATGTSAAPPGPVDVNTATVAELDALPGVGPSTAAAIVQYRTEHGPFATVDAVGEVRGIGPVKLAALRDLLTV